ncbi:hypothetical protein E4U55_004482 [Claviceps digitariae]|nr:hypothetical protein E4U55_004482 [Claviceps digitariae]
MSSPDPLNDPTMADLDSQPPSSATRRVTRSQSSQRFVALPIGSSPQRQMFVPSQLYGDINPVGSSARRKLFQSTYPTSPASSTPSRRLRRQTTTTTVPLRESIEYGAGDGTTPKPRGRPRKSNGTPMPGAGTKRRAATPVKRTPRRARTMTMTSREHEEPSFEPSLQATPTPKRNVRTRKTPGATMSTQAKLDMTPRASTVRRGRRRRQALAPDELLELADEVGDISLDTTQLPPVTSDDEVDLVRAPSESPDYVAATDAPQLSPVLAPGPAAAAPSSPSPATGVPAEPGSDIWIASVPAEPTPKAVRAVPRIQADMPERSPRFGATHILPQYAGQQEDDASQAGGYDDDDDNDNENYNDYGYGDMGVGGSDRSSIDELLQDDGPPTTTAMAPSAYDTIAQGEDFSMIFMESIQSLHPNFDSSVHSIGAHDELGEETSLIINKTLESLRQGADEVEPGDQVDADHINNHDAFDAAHTGKSVVEDEGRQEQEGQLPDMPAEQLPPLQGRDVASAQHQSWSHDLRKSPYRSRSPRKNANQSPLRHRVLKYSAMQAGESAAIAETAHSPTTGFPQRSQSHQHAQNAEYSEEGQSNLYEDSFSDIPDAVLTVATPRRPAVNTSYNAREGEADHAQVEEVQADNGMAAEEEGQSHHEDEESAGEEEKGEGDEMVQEEQVESEKMHQGDADARYHVLAHIAAQLLQEGQNGQTQQQEGNLAAIERNGLDVEDTEAISDEHPTRNLEGRNEMNEDDNSLGEREAAHQEAEPETHATEPHHGIQPEPGLFVAHDEYASQGESEARPESDEHLSERLTAAEEKNEYEAHSRQGDHEAREDTLGVPSGSLRQVFGQDGHDFVEDSRQELEKEDAEMAEPVENIEEDVAEYSVRGGYHGEHKRDGEEEMEDAEDVGGYEAKYGVQERYDITQQQEREEEMEDVEDVGQDVVGYRIQGRYNIHQEQEQEEEMADVEEDVSGYRIRERYNIQQEQEQEEEMADVGADTAGYEVQEPYANEQEQEHEEEMADVEEMENAGPDMAGSEVQESYAHQPEQVQEQEEEMEDAEEEVAQQNIQGEDDEERKSEQHDEEMTTNAEENAQVIDKHTTEQIVPTGAYEEQAQVNGDVYDEDDPVDKEMAAAMEAAIQAEEQRAIVASSIASTAVASDQARLPTPDDTPPQADLEAADQSAYKLHAGSRPLSRMRLSPRSPGRLSFDAGFAVEHAVPATTRSPSRVASSPRYPGRVGDAAPAVVVQRPEESEIKGAADDYVESGEVEDEEMEDHLDSGDEGGEVEGYDMGEMEEHSVERVEEHNMEEVEEHDMEEVEEHDIEEVKEHGLEDVEEHNTEEVEEDKGQDKEEAGARDGLVEQEPATERDSESESKPEPEPEPEPKSQQAAPVKMARPSFHVTPLHQVSSPLQEPQSLQQDISQTKTARPPLTAIVRAGQVLQNITSDPPSPEGRDKQLGSPFRRSVSKDSWNGSRDSQTSSHRLSRSPRLPRIAASAAAPASRWDSLAQQRAPSRLTATTSAQNVLAQPVRQSVEPPPDRARTLSHESPASSMRVTPPSEGALSWVAREGPISPSLRGDNSLREAAGLPEPEAVQAPLYAQETVQAPPRKASPKPQEEAKVVEEIRDDETDIWELEAQRETPAPARKRQRQLQQSFGKRVPASNKRRSVIPSPWTKKSIHRPAVSRMISQLVPDLSHVSEEPSVLPDDQAAADAAQSSETDEYSLLAQRQQEEEEAKKAAQAPASTVKDKKRFDLSSFFSSPAAVPGMLAQQLAPTKTRQPALLPPKPTAPMSMAADAPRVVPTSSMFPQVVPQKELRDDGGSARSASLSSPRWRQPAGAAWWAPSQQQEKGEGEGEETEVEEGEETEVEEGEETEVEEGEETEVEEEEEKRENEREKEMEEEQQQQSSLEADERCSSPTTPEKLSVPTIAQKQNFTPRPRQTSHLFFQPSSNRSTAVTPPRMQLSRADIHRWTQQTSDASEASSDFQRPPFLRPLRPLPPKNASPTKSALRSPMKPHTPGRVVDFTSSVLSPAEQSRARHDHQFSSHSFHFQQQQQEQPDPFPSHDMQRSHSSIHDISMEDAPPLPPPPSRPKQAPLRPLSQTTWSRRHWLLLDHILQLRRQHPFSIPYARHADTYLGKTVKSHGQSMTLQRWHLDCVDAFKAKVGGWDEAVLAKRLFALILGEQKRQRNKTIMFH